MNDNELRIRLHKSIDSHLSSVNADKLRYTERKETKMKKTSILLIAACLTLALSFAIAEVLGGSIFGMFGDKRLDSLAPYSVLETVSPISITNPVLGNVTAEINSAYFDGDSLLVAYKIENGSHFEIAELPQTPIEGMNRLADGLFPMIENAEIAEYWNSAVKNGTPACIIKTSVFARDGFYSHDGIDLNPDTGWTENGEDGVSYNIVECGHLPDIIREREKLDIVIRLADNRMVLYFDGKNTYESHELHELEPMRATVSRITVPRSVFRCEGTLCDTAFSAQAGATAASCTLTITFDKVLPFYDCDSWYDFRLFAEDGTELVAEDFFSGGKDRVVLRYEGTGVLPSELTLKACFIRNETEENGSIEIVMK